MTDIERSIKRPKRRMIKLTLDMSNLPTLKEADIEWAKDASKSPYRKIVYDEGDCCWISSHAEDIRIQRERMGWWVPQVFKCPFDLYSDEDFDKLIVVVRMFTRQKN